MKPKDAHIRELAKLRGVSYESAKAELERVLAAYGEHTKEPGQSFADLAGVLKEAIESEE